MSPKREPAFRKVYRFPCQLTDTAFRNLHRDLCARHAQVSIAVDCEAGPREDVPVETLLETGWFGRIDTVTIKCSEPTLQIQLADVAYREVRVSWDESSGMTEASLKPLGIAHWFNPLQLPCHLGLVACLIYVLFFGASAIASERYAQAESPLRENPDRAVIEVPEQAPDGDEPGALSGWLIGMALGLVVFVTIAVIRPLRLLVLWLFDLYERIFPAFYFDFPSTRHVQYSNGARWAVVCLLGGGVVALFTSVLV